MSMSRVAVVTHPRRNVWVGAPTAYTTLGNRLVPWLTANDKGLFLSFSEVLHHAFEELGVKR